MNLNLRYAMLAVVVGVVFVLGLVTLTEPAYAACGICSTSYCSFWCETWPSCTCDKCCYFQCPDGSLIKTTCAVLSPCGINLCDDPA